MRKTIVACTATALVIGAGTATASSLISGSQIRNGTLTSADVKNGSLRGADIHEGTITKNRLSPALRKQLALVSAQSSGGTKVGPQGPKGDSGAAGTPGAKGDKGDKGADGANPAVPVRASGDQGWSFSGVPSANFANGELHLSGTGVDSDTMQGGIGIVKAYDNVPLSQLSALSYAYHVNQRDPGSTQAPTIHVTVVGAVKGVDSKFDNGFTNLVYTPFYSDQQLGKDATRNYDTDAFAAGNKWWSSGAQQADGSQANPLTIQTFMTRNPQAKITQISLDNGGSSGSSGSFDAGADNLLVGFGSSFTRYDFGG
jgi:hypothetical protein